MAAALGSKPRLFPRDLDLKRKHRILPHLESLHRETLRGLQEQHGPAWAFCLRGGSVGPRSRALGAEALEPSKGCAFNEDMM